MSSVDLQAFRQPIKHDKLEEYCYDEHDHKLCAYKVDGEDGLRQALGFKSGQLSEVDYCLFYNSTNNNKNIIQLIELTNLSDDIKSCLTAETIFGQHKDNFATFLAVSPKKAEKVISSKIWSEVLAEFKNKWMGSIAISERLCRRNNFQQDYQYQLLIILTNDMNPKDLRSLQNKLAGMLGKVGVCTSQNADKLLSVQLYQ